MITKMSLLLLLSVGLLGCRAIPSTEIVKVTTANLSQSQGGNLGQELPIAAKAIIKGKVIELEVAQTPQQQALGLMFRESLAKNRGMLFPFESPKVTRFWMKNVPIALDIIFLLEDEVKAIAANVPPCQSEPCPLYGPDTPVDRVIELRGGRAAELGLAVGDRIEVESLNTSQQN